MVAIELQDLPLGVLFLDLAGQEHLLELPAHADVPVEEQVPGQLLGDRARALGTLPHGDLHDVVPDGPKDPAVIDAGVAEKAGVLGRDNGFDQDVGDLLVADFDAPLLGELPDGLAGSRVEGRDDLRLEGLEIGDGGEVILDGEVGAEARPHHEGDSHDREEKEGPGEIAPVESPEPDFQGWNGHDR